MRNLLIKLLLLGASLLMLSSTGFAEQNSGAMNKLKAAQHSSNQMALQQLNLTAEQKIQIKQLLQNNNVQVQGLMKQLNDNNKQLKSFIGEQYNANVVSTLAKQQGNIISQLIILKMEVQNKINGVLTPEQREKIKNLRRNRTNQ